MKSIFLASAIVAACTTANAAEPTLGIAPETTADIRGFTIGMTLNDAMKHIQSLYPNVRPKSFVGSHNGTKQKYTSMIIVRPKGEELRLRFTGHYSGNRIYAINRKVTYPQNNQASFPETRNNILAKYGLPTYVAGTSLNYVFAPETVMLGSEDDVRNLTNNKGDIGDFLKLANDSNKDGPTLYKNISKCIELIPRVQNPQFFNPTQAKGSAPAGCSAAMKIQLNGYGGLLREMKMILSDYQFVLSSKGLEFDRVLVVIDDNSARGFLFNYNKLFGAEDLSVRDLKNMSEGKETGVDRTKRLLYVTCTRAEKSLALVVYASSPDALIAGAMRQGWFEADEIEKL